MFLVIIGYFDNKYLSKKKYFKKGLALRNTGKYIIEDFLAYFYPLITTSQKNSGKIQF